MVVIDKPAASGAGRDFQRYIVRYWNYILIGIGLLTLGSVGITVQFAGKNVPYALSDPTSLADLHPLAGYVSVIGVLMWTASASALFLAFLICEYRRNFLFASFLLSMLMLIDDQFMGHDYILPRLGVPEILVLGAIGSAGVWYLWSFRRTLLEFEYSYLLAALGLFAVSIIVDLGLINIHTFFEDGPKFLGIVFWAVFFISVSRDVIVRNFTPGKRPDSAR